MTFTFSIKDYSIKIEFLKIVIKRKNRLSR